MVASQTPPTSNSSICTACLHNADQDERTSSLCRTSPLTQRPSSLLPLSPSMDIPTRTPATSANTYFVPSVSHRLLAQTCTGMAVAALSPLFHLLRAPHRRRQGCVGTCKTERNHWPPHPLIISCQRTHFSLCPNRRNRARNPMMDGRGS